MAIPARPSFLKNVLWNWVGVAATMVAAFFLSPFVVRQLGDENYGLWVVIVALVDYYWLLDFGMRAATVRFTAHNFASGDLTGVNQTVSSSLVYNLCIMPALVIGTFEFRDQIAHRLGVSNPLFPMLLFAVVAAWSFTSLFSCYTSCLEGLQRFDVINQTMVVCTIIRGLGTWLLLTWGYDVVALAYMTAAAQVSVHIINYFRLRRILPTLRFQWARTQLTLLKEMLSYGRHSVISGVGARVLSQGPPLMIAYFLPERFAGYYTNPRQLLDYSVEGVARIGNVSNTRAAALVALGEVEALERFSISVNRLSLAIFLPLSIFLAVYGPAFLLVWIKKPEFAQQASPVLLALLAGHTLANAGQYSSSSILLGMGKYQTYARTLMVEAGLSLAGMALFIPHNGIVWAAAWNSILMIANRALITPWLLTRELKSNYWKFMMGVNRPLLSVPPVAAALLLFRTLVPGTSWAQLIAAGAATMVFYLPIIYFLISAHERDTVLGYAKAFLAKITPAR